MAEYEPTGWWRCILKDGTLWAESSNEKEIRERAKNAPGPIKIQRHMRKIKERWEDT